MHVIWFLFPFSKALARLQLPKKHQKTGPLSVRFGIGNSAIAGNFAASSSAYSCTTSSLVLCELASTEVAQTGRGAQTGLSIWDLSPLFSPTFTLLPVYAVTPKVACRRSCLHWDAHWCRGVAVTQKVACQHPRLGDVQFHGDVQSFHCFCVRLRRELSRPARTWQCRRQNFHPSFSV